jgi:hypothetical protein
MIRTHTKILAVLVLAGVPAAAQVAVNDVYDRPNSNSLGIDWIEQDGDAKIANNKLEANSPFSFGWCSHSAFQAAYSECVIRARWSMNGLGGDAISLIAGVNTSTWGGIEARIQDNNGDGAADRILFNAAVNAGTWYGGPTFVNLTTPLVSGEATMWFSNAGDTVNVEVKDLATLATQVYSASGILAAPPTGMKVGIGYFGNGNVDDYRAWVGVPAGPVFTLTTPRSLAPTTLLVTDASPLGWIAVAYSGTGAGPIPTQFGIVGLSAPIEVFLQSAADATGRLQVVFPPLPSLSGVALHTQAMDVTTLSLTNYFSFVIF